MVSTKTTTLNLRINPLLKEALKIAAEKEHRSVANMIEVMIRQHCAEKRISIPDQHREGYLIKVHIAATLRGIKILLPGSAKRWLRKQKCFQPKWLTAFGRLLDLKRPRQNL